MRTNNYYARTELRAWPTGLSQHRYEADVWLHASGPGPRLSCSSLDTSSYREQGAPTYRVQFGQMVGYISCPEKHGLEDLNREVDRLLLVWVQSGAWKKPTEEKDEKDEDE